MSKVAKAMISVACTAILLCACGVTKKNYDDADEAPHTMTIVDETIGYTIYEHDETGVWYFCRDSGYGKSVVVMVNPDGTPYTGVGID